MDGIANLIGERSIPVSIAGHSLTLTPMTIAGYAEKEAYILSKRPHPLDVLKSLPEGTPADIRDRVIDHAMRRAGMSQFVGPEELQEFDLSPHGIAWNLARALRTNHPDLANFDAALELLRRATADESRQIILALDRVHERDILGNSSSPAATTSPPGTESRGPNFSATWPEPTDGPSKTSGG